MKIDQAVGGGGGGEPKIAWGSERQNMWNSERKAETTVMCRGKGTRQGEEQAKGRDGVVSFQDSVRPAIQPLRQTTPKKGRVF